MPQGNQTQEEKVLELIEVVGEIEKQASTLYSQKTDQEKKVAKLIPKAVQALLDNERIELHEKEAAEAVLRDPVKTMEILINTASHRNSAERTKLGQPVANGNEKRASYNSLNDSYVGRRTRPGEAESDKAYKRGLGLA